MKADEVAQKLTRARTQLLLGHPFFGALCLRLKLFPAAISTMATDGQHLAYGPKFVASLTPAELEGVLAHEVMHCALAHHCRRGSRDLKLWNQAADYAINYLLVANGFTLPSGALLDSAFDNLSAEEIYGRLQQSALPSPSSNSDSQTSSSGGGSGTQDGSEPGSSPPSTNQPTSGSDGQRGGADCDYPGNFGAVLDATDENGKPASEAEIQRQQQEWNIAAEQALHAAKSCGLSPLGVERQLIESRESKQDWRSALREFVAARDPADYRWTPPNRRHVYVGLYLPSVQREGIGKLVLAVDTSGSIGDKELALFAGEITAIADQAQPESIVVLYCDAAVQSFQEFAPGDAIQLEPKGGGGTNFRPAFEWVEQEGIQPACLIYLTDLCCQRYPAEPEYPTLWVTNSRGSAPFGETIRITLD